MGREKFLPCHRAVITYHSFFPRRKKKVGGNLEKSFNEFLPCLGGRGISCRVGEIQAGWMGEGKDVFARCIKGGRREVGKEGDFCMRESNVTPVFPPPPPCLFPLSLPPTPITLLGSEAKAEEEEEPRTAIIIFSRDCDGRGKDCFFLPCLASASAATDDFTNRPSPPPPSPTHTTAAACRALLLPRRFTALSTGG